MSHPDANQHCNHEVGDTLGTLLMPGPSFSRPSGWILFSLQPSSLLTSRTINGSSATVRWLA